MPQLAALVAHGASGGLASFPPEVRAMVWTTLATGRHPHEHGVLDAVFADRGTGRIEPMSSGRRTSRALWTILSDQGRMTHAVGWPVSHPAELLTGVGLSGHWAYPGKPDTAWAIPADAVCPAGAAEELAGLRVRPDEIDPEVLRLFVPRFGELDARGDARLQKLALALAELYTFHNATIALLDRGPCEFLAVHHAFIGRISREFMPFHGPRRAGVSACDHELYQGVVTGAYRLQDLLLSDLLRHAGPGATTLVCSVQGPRDGGESSPRDTVRGTGLFALAGPGVVRGGRVTGASVYDVVPTILHLHGLPVGADMAGRVWREALAEKALPGVIASWEKPRGAAPRGARFELGGQGEDFASPELLAASVRPAVEMTRAFYEVERRRRWHRALSLKHAGKREEAWALLEELHFHHPECPDHALHLALAQSGLGLADEAAATVQTMADYAPRHVRTRLLQAELALARGEARRARELVEAVPAHEGPAVRLIKARAQLLLGQWDAAAEACRSILQTDPREALAWLGLATACFYTNQAAEAERCALEALTLNPVLPLAEHTLALVRKADGRPDAAVASWRRALALDPHFAPARRALDEIKGLPFVVSAPKEDLRSRLLRYRRLRAGWIAGWQASLRAGRAGAPETRGTVSRPDASIRLPWPDELFRIRAAFPTLPLDPSRPSWVVVSGDPAERLLGVASLRLPEATSSSDAPVSAGFVCALSERVLSDAALSDALVEQVCGAASRHGAKTLFFEESLGDADPRRDVLRRAGFVSFHADDLWEIDPRRMLDRLERIHQLLTPGGRLTSFAAGPLTEADLPEVRTLVAETGLLPGESIVLARGGRWAEGFDRESSSVVRHAGRLTGVLLAKASGALRFVDVLAVAPAWRKPPNLTNHLLFHRSVSVGVAAGCERLCFVTDPVRASTMVAIARRFAGRIISKKERWRRDL